jgi:N-acetylmuramoyl-L-alanine amidase
MTISLDKLNSAVSTISSRVPVIDLQNAATDVIQQNTSKEFSVLGTSAGQVVNGIIGLTQEVDEGYEADVIEGIGLVQMGPDVPDITPDIIGDTSAHQTDIDRIIGADTSDTPFPQIGVTLPNGTKFNLFGGSGVEAIAAMLSFATGKNFSQLVPILQGLTSSNLQSVLKDALATTISKTLGPVIAEFNVKMEAAIGGTITSVLEDIADRVDGPIGSILNDLADGKLKVEKIRELVQAISDKNYTFVINEIAKVSSQDIDLIETTVLAQSTSIGDRIQLVDPYRNFPDFVVGSTARSWAGEQTNIDGNVTRTGTLGTGSGTYTFSAITSTEELEAELRSTSREITETVVHWTANFIDQDVGAREVHQTSLARGFSGCSYHFIIRRDGTIERGRPINIMGEHAGANGHNNYSIGISMVGGYNCLSGTPNKERYISAESLTSAQWSSLDQYLATFWKVFPGGQVFGHNGTDPGNKPDPGVDIPQYIFNKFGKRNVTVGTQNPLRASQLAAARTTTNVG